MDDMTRPRKPYLHYYHTRHNKWIWYVRKPGTARVRIRSKFGTPEFDAEYEAAVAGLAPSKPKSAPKGTLQWLWDQYHASDTWGELSQATRRQRENIMRHVLEQSGREPFADITKKTVIAGRARRKATPAQARNFLDTMRGLFRWAVKAEHTDLDPTEGVENPERKKSDGFIAWEEADVAKYEERWGEGTKERVWLHVLLYIGCRRGDAVLLGRQQVKDGVLSFTTEKGREKRPVKVSRRLEPELVKTLAKGPCGDLAFICGDRGEPLTKESFGNMFKAACVAAGITQKKKSAHGLRKLSATIWAERGATVHELMAMFGWLTVQMAELYTREADRKRLALGAHDRLRGTVVEHPMCQPDNSDVPTSKVSQQS